MNGTLAPLNTGSTVTAIVPSDFDAVLEFATLIMHSGLAPSTIKGKEAIAVALLHGMELGFTPMAALQSIAVINGRPSVWGDGALALCQASGLMDDFEESFEGTGDQLKAVCKTKRKGRSKPTTSEFSVADAKTAGLWDKAGPWKQHPKRMLKARARAFALRDAFPDVFRGLAIAEEQQDIDITPATRGGPPAPKSAPPAPAVTEAEFEEVNSEAAPPKPRAARAPKPEPEKSAETGKPEYDEAAQEEATRREQIEAAGQVYEGGEPQDRSEGYDDGSTSDPINPGDVEDAEIEDDEIDDGIQNSAPSVEKLTADLKAIVARKLPMSVYLQEMNSLAQRISTWDDFKLFYAERMPAGEDKALKKGHKTIMETQMARLKPEGAGGDQGAAQTGTADTTGLNQNIQGTIPWNGPTAYRSSALKMIKEAKKAWEAKDSHETQQAIFDIADDIKLKEESKVLGGDISKELKAALEAIIERF